MTGTFPSHYGLILTGEAVGGSTGKFLGATIGEAAQDVVEVIGGTGHAIGAGLANDVKKKDKTLSNTRKYVGYETKTLGDAVINQATVLACLLYTSDAADE